MKRLLLTMVFGSCLFFAFSQSINLRGKIKDENDQEIPGVSVSIKGSNNAVISDANGNFEIRISSNVNTLEFSSIGYKHQEITVSNNKFLTIILQTNVKQLNEVVATGFGTKLKRSLTTSISTVSAKELANTPVPTIEAALYGKTAGVFIEQGNGKLGQAIKVNIRGISSLSANTQPLYVIDGLPITVQSTGDFGQADYLSNNGSSTNPLADLDFNQVESVQILKDAGSTGIYGARGANGVIIITTKQGKVGKTSVTFSTYFGNNRPTHERKFLNNIQYLNYFRDAAVRGAAYDFSHKLSGYSTLQQAINDYQTNFLEPQLLSEAAGDTANYRKVNTNWQDQIFQIGSLQNYDLSIGGGTDKTKFYLDGTYNDTKGITIKNELNRFTFRTNLETKATDYLTVGANIQLTRNFQRRIANDDAFSTPTQATALTPFTPVIDPRSGLISGTPPGPSGSAYPLYFDPLINSANAFYNTLVYRNLGDIFAEISILPGLSFKTEIGIDILNQTENTYSGVATAYNSGFSQGGASSISTQVFNYNINNYFQYNKKYKKNSFGLTIGNDLQNSLSTSNTASASGFPSDAFKKLISAASYVTATSIESQYAFRGYFGRLNYDFDNKYLLQLSARYDGSSRFGANNRYGFFPTGSVGWVISEESFLKESPIISLLKLRLSYGKTGNADIGNFPSIGLFSAGTGGYGGSAGSYPTQLQNKNITWEQTNQLDLGTDFGFFGGRIDGTIDVYKKETSRLLASVTLPSTTGFFNQSQNSGKLENKGLEFLINTHNFVGNFKWTTGFNISFNRNKILDLPGGPLFGASLVNRALVGQPIGVFYTIQYAGVDPSNGDAIYYKNDIINGKLDKTITNDYNSARPVVVGNPNPKFIYGFSNEFDYKGFSLNIIISGVYGNQVYNGAGQYMSSNASNYFDNQTIDQLNSWKKPGDITLVPEARLFNTNGYQASSRYLSNASYLRCKTLSFSYTFPKLIFGKSPIQSLKIYFNANNLFTITPYQGWDPEVNSDIYSSDPIVQGYDFYASPQAKTLSFGLNIGF